MGIIEKGLLLRKQNNLFSKWREITDTFIESIEKVV